MNEPTNQPTNQPTAAPQTKECEQSIGRMNVIPNLQY